MATKTIPQLTATTSVDGNILFAIDTGTQTYKLSLSDLIASIEAILAPTRLITKNAAYNATAADRYILVTGTTTITMPAASGVVGKTFTIKNVDTGGLVTTVAFQGGETCDGLSTLSIPERYHFFKIISDGTNWHIVGW